MVKVISHIEAPATSSQWHVAAEDKAILHMIAGECSLRQIIPSGFTFRSRTAYNAERVDYDITSEFFRENSEPHVDHILKYTFLFEHAEPAHVFPSEELKTKILLVAG